VTHGYRDPYGVPVFGSVVRGAVVPHGEPGKFTHTTK
jgi:hypothetical protein